MPHPRDDPEWIRLRHFPGNASFRPHVLLREIGVPSELLLADSANAAHKSPASLKPNPNGPIPKAPRR